MRIIYNPDYLFTNIDKDKQKKYINRIYDLAKALEDVDEAIPNHIIDSFKIKKMRGTNNIFKFYLNNQDGSRCLFKYEKYDPQIFNEDKGIVLLRAVSHDNQGILGRKLDNDLKPFEDFLVLDIHQDLDESIIDESLGRKFMKTLPLSYIYGEELLSKMLEIDDKSLYKLSPNQLKAINQIGPIFLRGSAGSGKTLAEIAKALKNAHEETNQAYFTYTPLLKDTAYNIYKKYENMNGIKGSISFYVMKDYFLKVLNLSEYNYFTFNHFKKWYRTENFRSRYSYLKNIDEVTLWTEIRGLIKGYIGNDYYRILTFNNHNKILNDEQINLYLNKNYIKHANNSKTIFNIINSEKLKKEIINTNFDLFLINNDLSASSLDEYSYVEAMIDRYTLISNKNNRKNILKFVNEIYQPYLEKNNFYDDNDLARLLIKKINNNEIQKFDYVLIDELQDLTELQIIALTKLSKNDNNIMMAGDISQVINPTFFQRGRTGLIFKNIFNSSLKENIVLYENYRNSENIVFVIQKLLQIRQNKLGKYSDDIYEKSVQLNKKEGLPIFINLSKEKALKNIASWIDVPKVAIIVPDDETKNYLLKKFNVEGETNIYSVHEIKGQEFSKVLTYNIISNHYDKWEYIMSGNVDKGSDLVNQYRYYFNLLYVAITRGRENLFMFEDNKNCQIIKEIIHLFLTIDETTLDVLDVSDYDTTHSRLEQAQTYFNERDYLRAKTMYMRLNNKKMTEISSAYYNLEINNIEEALLELLPYEERLVDALGFIDKNKYLLLYGIYYHRTKKIQLKDLSELFKNQQIIKLAQKYETKNINNYPLLLKYSLELMRDIKLYNISLLLEGKK